MCGHDLKFLAPFIQRLERSREHEVRLLVHAGHVLGDTQEAERGLAWADVIFCEWALGNAVWFSRRKRDDQILVVRLHAQEVRARDRLDFIWEIDWQRVDHLVLITHHLRDWMLAEFPDLSSRSSLIFNPIPASTTLNVAKPIEARFVLGLVGVVPSLKRLDLAVALLRRLHTVDPRYVLRVKGHLPQSYPWMQNRPQEMQWYTQLFQELRDLEAAGSIVFDPHTPDMVDWYQAVGHILSLSDFEGSHQAVAEAMATGAIPVLRDWVGSDQIYPAKYVRGTLDGWAEMVLRHTEEAVFETESRFCRDFAQRFDDIAVCDALTAVLRPAPSQEEAPLTATATPARLAGHPPTVLILAYIPLGSRSGYRIRVEQEIQVLVQQGCAVHLACLVPPAPASTAAQAWAAAARVHETEFAELGCLPHVIEVPDFFQMHTDATTFQAVEARLCTLVKQHRVDVIHAEALYCARVAAGVKAALPELMFSIDWHGVAPEEARMGGAHANRVRALEEAERSLLTRSDLNVFVSAAMERHYTDKYGSSGGRHVIVPCCVSDQRFVDPQATPTPETTGLVFTYAGTMADWQCGLEMIQLFAALHRTDDRCRFQLLVPASDHDKVLSHAHASGLPARAYTLKSVSHAEVPQALAQADVAVLLRADDAVNRVSSPTKFGEYLAAGLPVLMTDGIGDFSELVQRTGTGKVLPASVVSATHAWQDHASSLRDIIAFAEHAQRQGLPGRSARQDTARAHLQWRNASVGWLGALGNPS